MIGSPMTYSLFEFVRESAEELVTVEETPPHDGNSGQSKKKEKKEVLSKQAKRKLADRTGRSGDRSLLCLSNIGLNLIIYFCFLRCQRRASQRLELG